MMKKFNEFSINENESNKLIDMWNNYLKLVDIIDGIISEQGELSNSYWSDNVEDELNDITDNNIDVQYIKDNKERIIKNFNNLLDGLNGWISSGHSISRYGSLSKINKNLFK